MIRNISLDYFPHTKKCPVDGHNCRNNKKCKLWIENKRCWSVEINSTIKEVFPEYEYSYIYFRDENNSLTERGVRNLHFHLDSDRFDNTTHNYFNFEIGFNSHRLAKKVKEKILKDWEFRSVNFEEGDDANLEFALEGNYENKDTIVQFLLILKNKLIPEIMIYENEINICQACKEKNTELIEYNGYAICFRCQYKIISENIEKYINQI